MIKNYRVYYWFEGDSCGVGVEEVIYRHGEAEILSEASIYIDERISVCDIFAKIIDEYCDKSQERIKIQTVRRFPQEDYDALYDKYYPKIRFFIAPPHEVGQTKELCFDALERKSTVFNRF